MNPKVAIIILNWNGWEDTVECLESVYQIKYPNYQIILVDNASQDDSLQKIREYCQGKLKPELKFFNYQSSNKPIKIREYTEEEINSSKDIQNEFKSNEELILIKNSYNHGFAKGNNIATIYALIKLKADYILLLNNDTIVDPDFLTELIRITQKDNKIGIVGSKLLNAYNPEIIDSTGHVIKWGRIVDRGHGEVDNGQYDDKKEIIGAMAASALYRSKMLEEIGLLDENYVTLCEDVDMSWRAHNNGWKSIFAPKSIVYHKRGRSITRKSIISKMTILSLKNTVKTVQLYASPSQKFLYTFVLLKEGIFVLMGRILGRNDINISVYVKLVISSYFNIIKGIILKKSN